MELILKDARTPDPARSEIGAFTRSLIARYRERQSMRREMRTVSRLTDHLLRDVGLEEIASQRRNSARWNGL